MSYKTLNPTYLVQFINGPLVLLQYFELDENKTQWLHVDFVVKFKEGFTFDIKECKERKGVFNESYANTIFFTDILTVDNIERFKLSPSLWSKESYLKQIYDGKTFDMEKINSILMISSDFIKDENSFSLTKSKIEVNKKTKKIPNYMWLIVMLVILLFAYVFYEYNYKKV